MKPQRIIALLGRRDEPTDAVEEYCHYLGEALRAREITLETLRVSWAEKGWRAALRQLRERATQWRGDWVLLQYTALAWSARGFPFGSRRVFRIARESEAKIGVVFHDARAYPGTRVVDAVRRECQLRVMRRLFDEADRVILTEAAGSIPWLPAKREKAVLIPVGANFDARGTAEETARGRDALPAVAVFGVTGGANIAREAGEIARAVNFAAAQIGRVRLIVLGRHALDAQAALERELDRARVELVTMGVLAAAEVEKTLRHADALLFVRGHISSRRSSAIAGIACGLPVVAYRGAETAAPITEAGVALAEEGDATALASELARVLGDAALRESLRERSRRAQEKYFSWEAIAARYSEALRSEG